MDKFQVSQKVSLLKEEPQGIVGQAERAHNGNAIKVNRLRSPAVMGHCNGTNSAVNGKELSVDFVENGEDCAMEPELKSAKYAMNFKSQESSLSSNLSGEETKLSSWEEFPSAYPLQGGKGKSFFPVNSAKLTRKINSFYFIPPPNFPYPPGVRNEKLV